MIGNGNVVEIRPTVDLCSRRRARSVDVYQVGRA